LDSQEEVEAFRINYFQKLDQFLEATKAFKPTVRDQLFDLHPTIRRITSKENGLK
jgi:hypothetical protein